MKLFFFAAAVSAAISCEKVDTAFDGGSGYLRIWFSENDYRQTRASGEEVPDTSEFMLTVTDALGKTVYDGKYGDSPENMLVGAGTYNISVRSGNFSAPAFAKPQFGDDQCVIVPAGGVETVRLTCVQMNSGIRLKIASGFLDAFPDGVLFLKSDDGKLMYSYSEKRIAYFNPGKVTLFLSSGGSDKQLFSRELKARQILVMGISVPSGAASSNGAIELQLDTSRIWINDNYTIGGSSDSGGSSGISGGLDRDEALNVQQAKSEIGAEDVWVYGYIVGGDLTSSSISFEAPFKSNTNIAIASRTSVDDKELCLSVQLPKGSVRDALNLSDNPSNLKRKVYLKGDITESYFGIPGIKNITDYVLE